MSYAENGPNGSHQRYFHKLVYEVYEDMNTPTHPCNESEVYSKDKCFLENLHDESIKQIGCTTPFGLNKSLICTDVEKAQKALDLYGKMQREVPKSCLNPCNYIIPHLYFTYQKRVQKNDNSFLKLENNGEIKVTKSELAYDTLTLLADIGGYVGLFLGIAIVHIKELFRILAQKFKSE